MWELFQNAGMVAWPLGACSVLALAIIIERAITLWRLQAIEDRASMILQIAIEKGDDAMLRDPQIAAAPITQIAHSLSELRGASEETIMQAAGIAVSLQRLRLRRYLGTLATIGSTAPFIGLFGTVVGIMVAFHDMGAGGGAGPDSSTLMRGISEALSATALGLLVAVPSVVAYNYFVGRVQGLLLHIHGHTARLAPLLRASGREEAGHRVGTR
jgi:biopolymer transport protein ExbB